MDVGTIVHSYFTLNAIVPFIFIQNFINHIYTYIDYNNSFYWFPDEGSNSVMRACNIAIFSFNSLIVLSFSTISSFNRAINTSLSSVTLCNSSSVDGLLLGSFCTNWQIIWAYTRSCVGSGPLFTWTEYHV